MPHAPGEDVRPKRKRKPAPKPRDTATTYRFNNPNHDTPPVEPTPTYGPGRISPPTSTLDRILAAGAGPLRMPAGKINIPTASHAAPQLPAGPQFQPPDRGQHRGASQAEIAHAQAAIDAIDARYRDQPGWIRKPVHDAATVQNLLPVGMATSLPGFQLKSLLDALNSLPAQQRDEVYANLPQIPKGQREAIQAVHDFTAPKDAISRTVHNFLPDALQTPQGIALGLYQLARATGEALPSASVGPSGVQVHSGDTTALQQAGNQTIEPFLHPGSFIENHPFQALISLSGIGRAGGAAAGFGVRSAARAGIGTDSRLATALSGKAPRRITSPGEVATSVNDATPIHRLLQDGTYSKNAWTQFFQRAGDRRAENFQGAFDRRVERQGQDLVRRRQAIKEANMRERAVPALQAGRKLSTEEQRAAVYAGGGTGGQGIRPSDLVAHYEQRLNDLREQLHTATGEKRGQIKRDIGYAQNALNDWKDVHASVGDEVTPGMQKLQDALRSGIGAREDELRSLGLLDDERMQGARQQPQDVILNPDEARPANPFYVRHAPRQRITDSPRVRRSSSVLGAREGLRQTRTGALLRSGNLDLSLRPQIERLAQPGDAAAAAHFLNDIRDQHGVPVSPGDHFDPTREQLVSAKTNADETMVSGYDVFRENVPKQHSTGVVPEGDWVLVPKKLYDERVAQFTPQGQGVFGRFGHTATNAFRWYALNLRPAWLTSNIVGNTAMSALGGVGPISAYRALDRTGRIGRHLPGTDYGPLIPRTVENQGMVAQLLRPKRGLLPRSDKLPQNPLRVANVTNENWLRRGLYIRHALPEYGKDIDALTAAKTAEERAPHVVKLVDRFLGRFKHGKSPAVGLAIPFGSWLWFVTRHTLYELPVHHPARALLLYRLGDLGNQASQYEGILNQSVQGAIPVGEGPEGALGPTTNYLRTGSLNPWATITQLASFDPREASGQPNFLGSVGALNPFGQIGYAAATGHEIDNPQFGPQSLKPEDRASYILGQLLNTIPALRLADPNIRIGERSRAGAQQPQASLLQRLFGYNVAGVTPVDTQLMNAKNIRGLISSARSEARR